MIPRLAPLLFLGFGLCAQAQAPVVEQIANLEQDSLVEASGLARSQRDPDILWALNDGDSKPRVYALDADGRHRGRLAVDGVKNRDWEDLASFTLDGIPYLLVADIGDNDAKHKTLRLHIVEEPDLEEDRKVHSKPAWTIRVTYPEGPRDAESLAVDIANEQILILTKRDLPPQLYSVPLRPTEKKVEATRLGPVRSLPWPSKRDVEYAPKLKDWHWQPTAMDVSDDGRLAAIMTYRFVFLYEKEPGEPWTDTFAAKPRRISLGRFKDAESMCIDTANQFVYVTTEKRFAPLLRATIAGDQSQ